MGILIYFCALVALVGGFALLLFTVALMEKLPVREYEKISDDAAPNSSGTAAGHHRAAEAHGYICCGTFRQNRGGIYKDMQTYWLSPDYTVLLSVGSGTIAGATFKKLRFRSRTPDVLLESDNEYGLVDISGIVNQEAVQNGSFEEVQQIHSIRCHALAGSLLPFDPARILEEAEQMQQNIYMAAAKRGLMKSMDHNNSVFKHTALGAAYISTIGYFRQLNRAKKNRNRTIARQAARAQ